MHFFPKADAALLSPSPNQHSLPPRPKSIGPIFDAANFKTPVESWARDVESCLYPVKTDPYAPASIPNKPSSNLSSRYLRCRLARNERLRLSMLWYYARDFDNEPEFLAGLQEKACLAQESSGWEYAVVGLLDINVYIRLATVGLELAVLPRGETLCAHTVTQPPGNVFLLPNMLEDWRFRESPYVEHGGLTAYAGVPLRMQHESGECVGLGSLCVASATSQDPLSKQRQQALARLADWIVADIVQCARARRQRERNRMVELIATVQNHPDDDDIQEPVLRILRTVYPEESISLQPLGAIQFDVDASCPVIPSDLKHGLWEDDTYIDDFIINSNHSEPPKDRVVRFISAQCESKLGPSVLVVATKNFRQIFDDVDSWFVQTCATMLSQRWQKRLLSDVMRAKEKFLRGVSHQLRTPIHGILGAAELLTEDLKKLALSGNSSLQPGLAEIMKPLAELGKSSTYLDTISTAGRELMSTVNSMITLNRWADIAAADRKYAVHGIDLVEMELVKGVSEVTLRDAHTRPSVFFHYNFPTNCDGLRIDLSLFRDSILPLIANAIQNTTDGMVTITLSTGQDSKTLIVDVEDTGCGIHPNDQKRIFELYEKVGEHSTGAGLGLTLATKFSTLLHGSIELVSSEVDRGSHFRATFRDIQFSSSSEPLQTIASEFEYLPSRFHYLESDSPDRPLSSNLAKFLTQNGFTSSDSSEDCFNVVDFNRISNQHSTDTAIIPHDQVAICLVPSEEEIERHQLISNIVFVNGPFSTSTLHSALHRANSVVAAMHDFPKSSSQSLPLPPSRGDSMDRRLGSDENLSSDEGYGSTHDTPVPKVGLSETPTPPSDSDSDRIVQTPQADTAAISMLPAKPLRTLTSSEKPMALIVDDNVVNLRILQMYCKKRGIPYRSAMDGQQAVEIFTEQQASYASGNGAAIELVLMDLQMPVCDGISATKQIRLLEKTKGSKASVLFIVTGQDSQVDRETASAAGADDYLVKPVGMRLLDCSVTRHFPALRMS
ncbi:hypothetical protein F66182_3301 [Fusarium sp. NRRL 66182]|nr:hypothetical protein F66182_3301 [Fusarium sp. NRRL 66182]